MTHTPAPDSPHRAVTLPGGSSRVKSSNTTCGTRQHASFEEKKKREEEGERERGRRKGRRREGGGRGEREREEEGERQ